MSATRQSPHRLFEEVISSAVTSHVLRDKLSPGAAYSLRILGQNQFGRGAASSSVKFMTKEESPDVPPIDIGVESRGATLVRVKWKPPPREHWNGQLRGYHVGFRLITTDEDQAELDTLLARGDRDQLERMYTIKSVAFAESSPNGGGDDQQEFILTGLGKSSTYSIIIQAYNTAGNGPFSQQIIASTTSNGKC